MAAGSAVGGDGGGNDGPKEKPRYSENKVYTRKSFKGQRNNLANNRNAKESAANTLTTVCTTTATALTSVKTNQNGSNNDKIEVSEPLLLILEDTGSAQLQPQPRDDNWSQVSELQALASEDADSAQPLVAAVVDVSELRTLGWEDTVSIPPGGDGPNEVSGSQTLVSADTGSAQQTRDGESIRVFEPQASVIEHGDSAQSLDGGSIEVPQQQPLVSEVTSDPPQQQQEKRPQQWPQEQQQLPRLGLGQEQEQEQQGKQVGEQSGKPQQLEPQEREGELAQELSVQHKQSEQQESPPLPPPLLVDMTSGDSSLRRQQVDAAAIVLGEEESAGNGAGKEGMESRTKIDLTSISKQEMREIRRKLQSELNTVKMLVKRVEAKQGQLGVATISSSLPLRRSVLDNRLTRVNSDVGPVGVPHEVTAAITTPTPRQSRVLHQLSVSVLDDCQAAAENVEKEKRTPKANQFYRNSEFLLAKDKFPPAESNKKSKSSSKKNDSDLAFRFGSNSKIFRNCTSLLERLMKHKHGWVFNAPVDVDGLRLHDYYTIIKHPMDLGTVKARLNKNWYKSPEEFAEDVRLTFHNALTYNPKGQDVHIMAEQLLMMFEERWTVVKLDYDREMRLAPYDMGFATPTSRKVPSLSLPSLDMRRILDRSESVTYPSVDIRQRPVVITPSCRTPAPKKPKAKDPHKRDMTYEEKQKLSTNLQSLPSDKLDNIVQIIKKRNSALSQRDDEIEVDIDSVDAETLWELDRFVTNYKKSLSKNKRKAELAMQAKIEVERNVQQKALLSSAADPPKEANEGDRNVLNLSPAVVDRQADNGSRSSSSSSSSSGSGSSSSESDSDSSASGSDIGR